MPQRLPHPCASPGCPALTQGRFCVAHIQDRGHEDREYDARRTDPEIHAFYKSPRWKRTRIAQLRRNPLCAECQRHGLVVVATTVDHVTPIKASGAWMDAGNLQSLCVACHNRKTADEMRQAPAAEAAGVVIVCGPPGSGKTRYVRERARRGDLIVDLDALFVALSGLPWYEKPDELLPYAAAARDAVIDRLQRGGLRQAWIIMGGAKRAQREALAARLHATVVMLDVAPDECLRRIQQDERRADRWRAWEPLVRDWWREYEQGTEHTTRG